MGDKKYWQGLITLAVGAACGFAFAVTAHYFGADARWCAETDPVCVREWIGALSGWVAVAVAIPTIYLLQRQLIDARLSSERQLRAYLAVDCSVRIVEDQIRFIIGAENSGTTPAYDVRVATKLDAAELKDWVAQDDQFVPFGVAHGGGHLYYEMASNLSPERIKAVLDGQTKLYLAIALRYRDCFGNERRTDTTNYATAENGVLDPLMGIVPGTSFAN